MTKNCEMFHGKHGKQGKDASLFLECGFNGFAKAKRGFLRILIA